MSTSTDSPTNKPSTPTACQQHIASSMDELRNVLQAAARLTGATPRAERESLEADICLASRSAHFDFYTWVVLNGAIDGPAAADLDQQFQRALAIMGPGKFKDSVSSRYDEFKTQCAKVRSGSTACEPASSF